MKPGLTWERQPLPGTHSASEANAGILQQAVQSRHLQLTRTEEFFHQDCKIDRSRATDALMGTRISPPC